MAEQLEQTLLKLLIPDNNVIQQATLEIKQMLRSPDVIPVLCQLISSSTQPHVRQYAAVLLRRKLLKSKTWRSVSPDVCQNIRQHLLQVMLSEPEKSVQKSLTQLVATIAKHDLPDKRWPEFFQFLDVYIQSNDNGHKETAMAVLSSLSSVAHEQLKPHLQALLSLCSVALDDQHNHKVSYYAIQTLMNVIPVVGSDFLKPFQSLIPKVMTVIQHLIRVDEDLAVESLEMLEDLAHCEVTILSPFVRPAVQFSLDIANNRDLDSKLRIKALCFIMTITRQKKKSIMKMNLVPSILDVVFPIMCDVNLEKEDEEEEDEEEGTTSKSPSSVAGQVIDAMALSLPAEKFISALMKHVGPALKSGEPSKRQAAFLAIAVSSEGCADCMRTKHLKNLLENVYAGMNDLSPEVRGAAMFALGQFSDYLQPDISKYSSELLPLLFECLAKTSHNNSGMRQKDVVRTYYAVEMFCENLGKDVVPYLSQLMPFLLEAVRSAPLEGKELAISAIGATASAATDQFLPYFQDVMELLKGFLHPTEDEKLLKLKIQAIDVLGVLARVLGDNFRPISVDCISLGLNVLSSSTDPDLKRAIYSLFGSISTVLKDEMLGQLSTIVGFMVDSIQSTEGLTASFKDSDMEHVLNLFDGDDDATNGDDDNDDVDISDSKDEEDQDEELSQLKSFEIQNSYTEEKEDALTALGELALNTGPAFRPFLEETFKEVFDMLEYPIGDVRRAAVSAVGQYCCAANNLNDKLQDTISTHMLSTMLSSVLPKLLSMVREEEEKDVVSAIFDTLNEMMKEIKGHVVAHLGPPENLILIIKETFQEKLKCQGEEDEVDEEDEEQAETDSFFIENTCELLPRLADLFGGEKFAPYFAGLLPELLKKTKKSCTPPEKSFAIGTIAETIEKMGSSASHFANVLYPIAMAMVIDDDEEVRNNAVFCLGVVASNGGPSIVTHYKEILKRLVEVLNRETNRRVIDNVCAAICRMIIANADKIPLEQVLPTVIQYLPLEEDKDEHLTVMTALALLYSNRQSTILSHLPQMLKIIATMLISDISEDVKAIIVNWIRDASQNFPEVLNGILSSLNEQIVNNLKLVLVVE